MRANGSCAIVGGGMLGMRMALDLSRAGHDVTIFERASALGGLAAPWEIGDVTWDRFYHVILPSDRWLLELLEELELGSSLSWSPASSAFFVNGRLRPFTTPLDFARFPAVGWIDKARLAATILRARNMRDHELDEIRNVPVEKWLRYQSGDRAFERLWLPLLRAKLGGDIGAVSASFIVSTIRRLYGNDRGRDLQGRFGYVRGGYRRIVHAFARLLESNGVGIRCNAPIERIDAVAGGIALRTGGQTLHFDRAVLTIPPPLAAPLCPKLLLGEQRMWEQVEYRGVICASLLLDKPLGDAYVTNLADGRLPFTAIIEMSKIVDPAELGGRHLVYLPKYLSPSDADFALDDREIGARFVEALQLVHPAFDTQSIRAIRVARAPYVFALPRIDGEAVAKFRTSVPGLFLASSAQIIDGTLNVNQTLELAARAAATITPARALTAGRGAA